MTIMKGAHFKKCFPISVLAVYQQRIYSFLKYPKTNCSHSGL